MSKPVRYTLAVLACVGCYLVCIMLLMLTGIGGIIAASITCFFIKEVWNGIVHYGENNESKQLVNKQEELQQNANSQEL